MTCILLIYPYFKPRSDRSSFRFPPLGLGYLASSLRSSGYQSQLLDCTFLDREEAWQRARESKADIVGIYSMVSMQRQLKIKSKYLETSRINMQLAEKSFMNGSITVDEYSRVSEIESRTESEYETIKVDFLSAYQTLEVMVGMKFNLYNINR